MRHILFFALQASLLLVIMPALAQTESTPPLRVPAKSSTMGERASGPACLSDADLSSALKKLSTAPTYAEQQGALTLLRTGAERSQRCRAQVVQALVGAMDKPNLDLFSDRPSFYLWHYGSKLLADLKAVEALDLLIAHLNLHDGTAFPLNHYPALGAVIDMGELALPKLEAELKQNPDRYMRRYAVFCVASIGGPSSERVLRQALITESDPCVTAFIKASLEAFDNKVLPNRITSENRAKWYATFVCHGD